MPVDAAVRVSFESSVRANQAANKALVGHTQDKSGPGPFQRVGTAFYTCSAGDDAEVAAALADLSAALSNHAGVLDHFFVSVTRRPQDNSL